MKMKIQNFLKLYKLLGKMPPLLYFIVILKPEVLSIRSILQKKLDQKDTHLKDDRNSKNAAKFKQK